MMIARFMESSRNRIVRGRYHLPWKRLFLDSETGSSKGAYAYYVSLQVLCVVRLVAVPALSQTHFHFVDQKQDDQ